MQPSRIIARVAAVVSFATITLVQSAPSAASNMTLTIDGIATPIEVLSFKFDASNAGSIVSGGGGGAGKVAYSDFLMTASESAATPLQLLAVSQGNHLRSARLQVLSSNGLAPVSEWAFDTVVLTSVGVESGAPDPKAKAPNTFLPPQTSFSLQFGKVCYRVFGRDGKVAQEMCWNVATNVAS